ncbi:MAG: PQQ-binding-like beta-propeller repeat protein, partial [Myxococcota bacterium]
MHAHHLAYLTPFLVVVLSAAAVHAEGLSAEGGRVRLSQVTHPEAPQPMMLHDRHHTALSRHPGPTLGRIRWSIELHGRIVGSGAVDHQGHSYWATAQGLGGQLHALDPDGILIRSIPLGGDTNSSPALGPDGEVYISTRNGDLIAFETDGRERWRHQTQLEILSSPLVDVPSGRVIFSARDRTIGLDLKTGKLAFEFDAQNSANNSSPTLGPDGLIRITNWGGFAAAIAGSGELVWKIPIGRSGFWASPTLGAFGTLYTASQNGDIIALSPNGRILWHTQAPGAVENFLGLSPDGHLVVPVSRHGIIAL